MLECNIAFIEKHRDILSFRDLAPGTVSTYTSYLTTYINWVEEQLPDRTLSSVTWEEIRSYIRWLKDIRKLNPRTINVHIAQLHDFFYYVLNKDWDKREVPFLHFDQSLPAVPTREQVHAVIDSISNPKHKASPAARTAPTGTPSCPIKLMICSSPMSELLTEVRNLKTGSSPDRKLIPISVSRRSTTSLSIS